MNVSKDIQCSIIFERHRYKVLSDSESKGNMNPSFCKFSLSPLPPTPPPPMSELPPYFIIYQNILPLIKPYA